MQSKTVRVPLLTPQQCKKIHAHAMEHAKKERKRLWENLKQ